jgi:hypothetical protein
VPEALSHFYHAMLEKMPGSVAPTGLHAYQKVETLVAGFGSKSWDPISRKEVPKRLRCI